MMVIPAIDLKDGACVRLVQGDMDQATVYSDDPVKTALEWERLGAERLHVVDLNGAFAGSPKNQEAIEKIMAALSIPVQLGGGIRDMATIRRLFDLGLDRIILGTVAVKNPALVALACAVYGEKIILGLDAKDFKVAVEGWGEDSGRDALQLALEMKEMGIRRIIFTDTDKDGTLAGVNVQSTKALALKTGLPIIASGGLSSMADLKALLEVEDVGIEGVITGKAIYSGKLDFAQAVQLARKGV